MEHYFIETKMVTQLINKVSVFCGNELNLRKFGREDVNLIELAWISCVVFKKYTATLCLKSCESDSVLA